MIRILSFWTLFNRFQKDFLDIFLIGFNRRNFVGLWSHLRGNFLNCWWSITFLLCSVNIGSWNWILITFWTMLWILRGSPRPCLALSFNLIWFSTMIYWFLRLFSVYLFANQVIFKLRLQFFLCDQIFVQVLCWLLWLFILIFFFRLGCFFVWVWAFLLRLMTFLVLWWLNRYCLSFFWCLDNWYILLLVLNTFLLWYFYSSHASLN